MTVAAHWLDADFTRRRYCLSVKHLTTDSPADQLTDALSEWSLDWQSVHAVVTSGFDMAEPAGQVNTHTWFPALRFRSSVTVSPCSVSKVRKNYVHP